MDISTSSAEELDDDADAENARKVEAALFIAGRFLGIKDLVSLTDINPILLRRILDNLIDEYKNSGIEIVKKNEMWKMDVASEYRDIVNRLATGKSEFTKAEQETLAIIAYKQPIKQSVIIKIRGNKGYDHIRRFVELGLVNKKKMGHTADLSLSESFYEYFHVGEGENIVDTPEESPLKEPLQKESPIQEKANEKISEEKEN